MFCCCCMLLLLLYSKYVLLFSILLTFENINDVGGDEKGKNFYFYIYLYYCILLSFVGCYKKHCIY